jgi:hypothetical protein
MKYGSIGRRAVMAGALLALAACEDGLTDVNVNPNAPTDVAAEFLLPESIRTGVEIILGDGMMLAHTSIWPQQTVELQYPDEEQGNVRPERMDLYWDTLYSSALNDVQAVVEKGRAQEDALVEGVGLTWTSWLYQHITDLWGDVPYTEALRADEGITEPAYDPQQDIYMALLSDLATAQDLLASGEGAGFANGDILYGGDYELWRRFANSLRMRMAMRMSEVDATNAAAEFAAAYAAGGFESNADNAMLVWPGAPYRNPLFEDWQTRDDFGVSATMITTLEALADPRLEMYAEPAQEDGVHRGLQNNVATPPLSISNYSRIGNLWRENGATTPSPVMTYAEVLFLQAEAAARGWIAGDPAALYEEGIRANMQMYDPWGAAAAPTDAEIDAYLAQPEVAYSPATGIEQINLQKWIALYMNGAEAWANTRRIDVPALVAGPDLTLSRIPVRFMYPGGEQSLNAANLQEAVARQGGGLDLVTPLWWDVG